MLLLLLLLVALFVTIISWAVFCYCTYLLWCTFVVAVVVLCCSEMALLLFTLLWCAVYGSSVASFMRLFHNERVAALVNCSELILSNTCILGKGGRRKEYMGRKREGEGRGFV